MGKGKGKRKAKIKQKQKAAKKQKNIVKKQQKPKIAAVEQQKNVQKLPGIKVCLGQVNTTVGDIAENTRKIIAIIEKAKETVCSVVVFPSLSITGYPPQDLLLRQDFVDMNMQKFIEIVNATKGITCIFGFVNKGKGALYNAVAVVKDQKILGIQHKSHLVDLDYFTEKRYFTETTQPDVIQLPFGKIGVIAATGSEEELTVEQLALKGLDMLFVLSNLPFMLEKNPEGYYAQIAKKYHIPIFYCNGVGASDALILDGGSFALDKEGNLITKAKKFGEELCIVDSTKKGSSFVPQQNQAAELHTALLIGIREYFLKSGHGKAVIGVSGGLDSAVLATLAVQALGKENVTAFFLPSKVTNKESSSDARKLCAELGIPLKVVTIDNAVMTLCKPLGLKYEKKSLSLTEQNIQARVRAEILMAIANTTNSLVISATNKTDLSTGYFTLYGEAVGALLPLGDLWKTQIIALAQYLNAAEKQRRKRNIIPESILKKPYASELRAGQKDSDDLPPYETLDKILQLYLIHRKDIREIAALGFDAELVRKVVTMVVHSAFKRQQIPPVLRISSSFPQYPVINGWRG